jgi:hypothetical protein
MAPIRTCVRLSEDPRVEALVTDDMTAVRETNGFAISIVIVIVIAVVGCNVGGSANHAYVVFGGANIFMRVYRREVGAECVGHGWSWNRS